MAIEKNDFIEVEFTGKTEDGEVFDTTKKEDAKSAGLKEEKIKPLILSVGNDMVVKGLDDNFIGKEIGEDFSVKISSENAFGKRDANMVQMVPLKNFSEQEISPQRGMQFSFDGKLARVISVSGGRVLVDFNNILAGKNISYDYKILRLVEDKKEQLDSLQDFFFRRKFDSEKTPEGFKIKIEKELSPLFDLMKKRFEEILKTKLILEIKSEEKKA